MKLIKRCTDENLENRPTFSEIYRMLANHDVAFPDTEQRAVDAFLAAIHQQETHIKRRKFVSLAQLGAGDGLQVIRQGRSLQSGEGLYYFQALAHRCERDTPVEIFLPILSMSRRLTETREFAQAFVRAQMHLRMPYDKPELFERTFPILLNIERNVPNAIDAKMAEIIVFLARDHKKKVLYIAADSAQRCDVHNAFHMHFPATFFSEAKLWNCLSRSY